ncbi:alpha/beta fold hydrolase [Actinokineospora auranticolor]|uniref:alpha/beta fold hydrolase n=1 Tax=Actinokineospora auranticolor TaxID=155976 RepID=UPI0035A8A5C4
MTSHSAAAVEYSGPYGPIGALLADTGGPYAVLVPGYTGSKEDFAPLLDPLAAAGFSPLAVDLPGQQDSTGPAVEDEYLPGPLGDVVAGLVNGLDRPVVLLGHSYGGLVVRRAVLAGARVRGLTLLSSGPADLPHGPRRQVLDLGEPLLRAQGIAGAHRALEVLNAGNPRWLSLAEPVREFLNLRFLRNRPESLLGMSAGLRTEPDLVGELGEALGETPRLVVCGETDDAWPTSLQRWMAERLGSEFVTVVGAGHSPAVENPEGLLAVLLPAWKAWVA